MADKQTPCELLGLGDEASPADIQDAYAALRLTLDAQPDNGENTTALRSCLTPATLLRDQREGERGLTPTAPPTHRI